MPGRLASSPPQSPPTQGVGSQQPRPPGGAQRSRVKHLVTGTPFTKWLQFLVDTCCPAALEITTHFLTKLPCLFVWSTVFLSQRLALVRKESTSFTDYFISLRISLTNVRMM